MMKAQQRPRVPLDDLRRWLLSVGSARRSELSVDTCRCNGAHILEHDEEGDARCQKCGRARPWELRADPSHVDADVLDVFAEM